MKRSLGVFAVVCSFLVFAALPLQAEQVTLTWTAGGAGGGWYSIAGGIATIIKEADPDIVIKVVPGGGLQNPAVVASKGGRSAGACPS
jgi:TRAP-type uncharacterized transport system substrate-binding protein